MSTGNLFSQACIADALNAVSKKQLFQEMAELAVSCGAAKGGAAGENASGGEDIKARDIVSAIVERERLGSTGIGAGVAIPHARLPGLRSVKAVFARLETPLDYESIDEQPVDLVILLLAPTHANNEHLKALAQISRLMRKEELRAHLRQAPNVEALYLLLTESREASAA